MPKVSVIIPTYERAHLVSQAIDSILAQTYDDREIIVVNDGSTDNTAEILAGYADRITLIHQENRGVAAARNAGMRVARGEYIAFLDDDDLWEPQKLAQQIPLLEIDPLVGLVSSDMVFFDEEGIHPGTYWDGFIPPATITPWTLLKGSFLSVPTIVIRQSCLAQVGYFDENLQVCEDYDLWLRIVEGWKVDYINAPLVRCFRSQDRNFQNLSKNIEQMILKTIQVKIATFDRNPQLRQLPRKYLDACLKSDYHSLANLYAKNGELEKEQEITKILAEKKLGIS
jgi:glycosyltransferase involved in cell wall biosynthesis